ncbi:unnamed protein product [marine sediment metagenome]|uniref:Uncharacterized protein n=1 Tax=marine sediment metagenome TaxID=412755 RepID=X0WWI2_9ZZZZ
MTKDQIIIDTLKSHKKIVRHGYTFDYKHFIFTGTKEVCDAFLSDLKDEFISPFYYDWDGAYDKNENEIHLIWI